MRWAARVITWIAVGLAIGLLSALVSAVLFNPVLRQQRDGGAVSGQGGRTAPTTTMVPPAPTRQPPRNAVAVPRATADPPAFPPLADEPVAVARGFVDFLAAADLRRALALVEGPGVPEKQLVEWAGLDPVPDVSGLLPGGDDATSEVVVWVDYRVGYQPRRGFFRVILGRYQGQWRVTGTSGPVAPRGGYLPFPFPAYHLTGEPVLASDRRGPLLLWTARAPEPGLTEQMEELRRRYAGRVQVVLALDLATAAGWDRQALNQGWLGPIWRVKGSLERLPLLGTWAYRGAFGVMVDRRGLVVAPLGAMDPTRYGLDPSLWAETADQVLRAYNLLEA